MKLISKQTNIDNIVENWFTQYPKDKDGKGEKLKRLKNPTANEINTIIGNSSWTDLRCCSECDSKEECVMLGEDIDYDSSTALICESCLKKALNLFKD